MKLPVWTQSAFLLFWTQITSRWYIYADVGGSDTQRHTSRVGTRLLFLHFATTNPSPAIVYTRLRPLAAPAIFLPVTRTANAQHQTAFAPTVEYVGHLNSRIHSVLQLRVVAGRAAPSLSDTKPTDPNGQRPDIPERDSRAQPLF